jgi:hypothetical protein
MRPLSLLEKVLIFFMAVSPLGILIIAAKVLGWPPTVSAFSIGGLSISGFSIVLWLMIGALVSGLSISLIPILLTLSARRERRLLVVAKGKNDYAEDEDDEELIQLRQWLLKTTIMISGLLGSFLFLIWATT